MKKYSSIMKKVFVFLFSLSRFPAKSICCISFGSASSVVVYLNLFLSSYNIFQNNSNLVDNQLRIYLLDQLQSFECFHMFLGHFLPVYQKKVLLTEHNIVIVYFHSWKTVSFVSCSIHSLIKS